MRCPVCRADNTETTCRRCRADLTLLTELEQARRSALGLAANAIAANDGAVAVQHAEVAHRLRPDRDTWRVLAVGYLLQRDFARALTCHHQAG